MVVDAFEGGPRNNHESGGTFTLISPADAVELLGQDPGECWYKLTGGVLNPIFDGPNKS